MLEPPLEAIAPLWFNTSKNGTPDEPAIPTPKTPQSPLVPGGDRDSSAVRAAPAQGLFNGAHRFQMRAIAPRFNRSRLGSKRCELIGSCAADAHRLCRT
jgi:hypothetical protein